MGITTIVKARRQTRNEKIVFFWKEPQSESSAWYGRSCSVTEGVSHGFVDADRMSSKEGISEAVKGRLVFHFFGISGHRCVSWLLYM